MKKLICVAVMVLTVPCFAGQSSAPEVTITNNSPTLQTATGSVRGAALSNDSIQLISCKVIAAKPSSIGSSTVKGECTAVNQVGVQLKCLTSDAALIQVISTVTSLSTITFTSDPTKTDSCRAVTVDNTSAGLF